MIDYWLIPTAIIIACGLVICAIEGEWPQSRSDRFEFLVLAVLWPLGAISVLIYCMLKWAEYED